jgi:glucose dehydrogenase
MKADLKTLHDDEESVLADSDEYTDDLARLQWSPRSADHLVKLTIVKPGGNHTSNQWGTTMQEGWSATMSRDDTKLTCTIHVGGYHTGAPDEHIPTCQ